MMDKKYKIQKQGVGVSRRGRKLARKGAVWRTYLQTWQKYTGGVSLGAVSMIPWSRSSFEDGVLLLALPFPRKKKKSSIVMKLYHVGERGYFFEILFLPHAFR